MKKSITNGHFLPQIGRTVNLGVAVLIAVFGTVLMLSLAHASTTIPCIVTNSTDMQSISISGSAKLVANNCGIVANTHDAPGIVVKGASSIAAASVCSPGGAKLTGSSTISPAATTTCSTIADFFASTPKPAVGSCNFNNASYGGNKIVTLQPGVYCGRTTIGGSAKVTFAPGVYIINNGSLSVGGNAQMSGSGVALYLVNHSNLAVGGSAQMSLTAPTSGTLSGFVLYSYDPQNTNRQYSSKDRDDDVCQEDATAVTGSAQLTLNGATYLPTQTLSVEGSGQIIATSLTTFFVNQLSLSGNATLTAAGALPVATPDTQAPIIAPHENINVTGSPAGANVTYTSPTATDNVDTAVAVSCTPASGSIFPVGTTTVTCTAHDTAGNQATPTQFLVIVTVPDTTAPIIGPHPDIFAQVNGTATGLNVSYTNPTATDDQDPVVPVSCTPASGSFFSIGSTTVTCSAHDSAGNQATSTTFVVGVVYVDTIPPVISQNSDITVTGTSDGAVVSYPTPTATDNVDGTDPVSCTPASGGIFAPGTTTVTCTTQDAAGNQAVPMTFNIFVHVPQPYTMASQPDESFFCFPDWRDCFTSGNSQKIINLGQGSNMGQGTLKYVTISKDEASPFVSKPWIIELRCYTNSTYTTTCPDWVQPTTANANQTFLLHEVTASTTDNQHWIADFTDGSRDANFNGTSPVVFNPNYYYQLVINDDGWEIGAYGSQALSLPYYVITGMTF